MVTFHEVQKLFESKGCRLDMTEEEFVSKKRTKTQKYKYIASCGHEHEVWLHVFLNRNTGVKCPQCVNAVNREKALEKYPVGTKLFLDLEYHSILYMKSIIDHAYDVEITCEGCLADVAIKPKKVKNDEWMMVQVKSCFKPNRGYNFKCSNKYTNCVIFCLCDSDKKMWLFDGNNVNISNKIAIGLKKSKYDDNEVTKDNLLEHLDAFYNKLTKTKFEITDTPISEKQKKERTYRKLRESMLPFIEFHYPSYHGTVYDFMISNYKVQEKVGYYSKRSSVHFVLHKHNGYKSHTSYKKGDNDFYWLHFPDMKRFLVIPEYVLIERNYINTEKKKTLSIYDTASTEWIQPYLFEYASLDFNRLKDMFR